MVMGFHPSDQMMYIYCHLAAHVPLFLSFALMICMYVPKRSTKNMAKQRRKRKEKIYIYYFMIIHVVILIIIKWEMGEFFGFRHYPRVKALFILVAQSWGILRSIILNTLTALLREREKKRRKKKREREKERIIAIEKRF